jgi:hypothetical protein
MVSFENFVKSMPPSLSELKVTPSFCFLFKIPYDPTPTNGQAAKQNFGPYEDHTLVQFMRSKISFLFHFRSEYSIVISKGQ